LCYKFIININQINSQLVFYYTIPGLGAGRPPASVSHRRSTSSSAPSTEEGTTKRENDENEENPKNLDLQREIKGEMEENPMKMGDNEEAMGKLLDQYYRLSLAAESKPKRNNKIDGKAKRAVVASPS
jgi:hypothetical protein